MKRWLLPLVCISLFTPVLAVAQLSSDAATKEDVQQMFELVGSRKAIEATIQVLRQQVPAISESALRKQKPDVTPEEIAKMNAFTNAMLDKMFATMPIEEMMQAMVPAYQRHFTHSEIQELIQFYKSPLGKKMIDEMPKLMTDGMQAMMPIMQNWMDTQMTELKASTEEYAKTLKEEKKAPPAPKTKPAS